jgi:hypothetical protein
MKLQREEVPSHFEAVRLAPWVGVVGWPVVVASAVTGVVLAARASSRPAVEVLGVALAVVGALLIAGLVRCRTFETVVGRRLLTVGVGPLRRRVPIGLIEATEVRGARSWRRLFAASELELVLSAGRGSVTVPTRDPEALAAAVRDART